MAGRSASGSGSIRKKTVKRNGKSYTYWEGRVTVGRDPGTGKQVQRSFSGKTQKEVLEKMQAAAVSITEGTYLEPSKMTLGQWLDIWLADYLGSVKPTTAQSYEMAVRIQIKPALGAVQLQQLSPHQVQGFVNGLDLSPGTVKRIYVIFRMALDRAVKLGYLTRNPTDLSFPRMQRPSNNIRTILTGQT